MSGDDKSALYDQLFGRQKPLELGVDAAIMAPANPRVAIAGTEIDFEQPAAVRLAAQRIFSLPDREARRAALDEIPPQFRETVRILVERAFYNKRWLAGR